MYKFIGIFFIVGAGCFQSSFAESPSGRVSVTDREIIERLTRLDKQMTDIEKQIIRLEEGQKALNQRIGGVENSLNKRIDDLKQTMHWGFGILFAMIIALFGYIVWDRRTALMPVVKKTEELKESNVVILKALKEYARKEPKLAEVLRSFGLF